LRLHFAKQIKHTAWRKPFLTRLEGCNGALGAMAGRV